MIAAGIDSGAKNIKAIIMKDGQILGKAIVASSIDIKTAINQAFEDALHSAGIERYDVGQVVVTGSGSNEYDFPYSQITEVNAALKGILHLMPAVRTVIDVGAEESKAMRIGHKGNILDFALNDKCAAGTGSFVEATARALEVSIEDMAELYDQSTKEVSMNAQCAIFAESEVVSLIHSQTEKADIAKAVLKAIADRTISVIRKVGIEEEVAAIGGMALNSGFIKAIERELNIRIVVPQEPQYVSAIGAAIAATEKKLQDGYPDSGCNRVSCKQVREESYVSTLKGERVEAERPPIKEGLVIGGEKNETKEFWRWPESHWTNPELDWRIAHTVACGIDVGSVSTQCVIMADDELFCYGSMRTGSSSPDSALRVFEKTTEGTGLTFENVSFTIGTGYGRVNVPFSNKAVTEIACHGKGANWMYGPSVRTVLDMGGQDCKVIKIDEKGKVTAFLMNDKCAAGTGRGMEVIADLLGVPIEDVGRLSLSVEEEPLPVSSTCVVFAKSEAMGLLRAGWPKERVLAAYCSAMAHRVVSLLQRIGVEREFAITGGIAKNQGVVERISRELGIEACEPQWYNKSFTDKGLPFDTQIAGALGAALFAKALAEKRVP